MAADYIAVSRTARTGLGNQLVSLANQWVAIRQLAAALKAIKDHQNNAGNFAVMEAQFSLAAGDGVNVSGILDNVNTLWNTATDVLGATRASQQDELAARLAGQ